MASPIRLGSAFFCEDIRTEDTGKLIFLGTYSGAMTSTVNPGTIYVNLVVILRSDIPAKGRLQLKVSHGEKSLADADSEIEVDDLGHSFIMFPPLLIEGATETLPVFVDARIDDDPWERLHRAPFIVPPADEKYSTD